MPSRFPELKDGDALEPYHLNIIYRELERWRKMSGSGVCDVDFADGDGPPVVTAYRGEGIVTVLLATGIAAGTYGTPAVADATILVPKMQDGGGYEATDQTEEVYNAYATAITGTNKVARCFREDDGYLYILVGDC